MKNYHSLLIYFGGIVFLFCQISCYKNVQIPDLSEFEKNILEENFINANEIIKKKLE